MSRPDDDHLLDLHDQLRAAIGDEPPMRSLPDDDVARGRKLVRRRRRSAVVACAAVIPAMVFGGWAVSSELDLGSSPAGTSIAPAASSVGTDVPAESCTPAVVSMSTAVGAARPDKTKVDLDGRRAWVSSSDGSLGRSADDCAETPGDDAQTCTTTPEGMDWCGIVVEPDCVEVGDDATICTSIDPGDPQAERLLGTLTGHLDPEKTQADSLTMTGTVEGDEGELTGIYVSSDWNVADRQGMVSLSVEDSSIAAPADGCEDSSLSSGPAVSCERVELADGTVVMIGSGQLDGAARITACTVSASDERVCATADAASQMWWEDGSGPAPLDAAPAAVDALIDLVTDPAVHL